MFPFSIHCIAASITGTLLYISKGKEVALTLNSMAAVRSVISLAIVGSTWKCLLVGRHSDSEEI